MKQSILNIGVINCTDIVNVSFNGVNRNILCSDIFSV
jgi:hypothetical protein